MQKLDIHDTAGLTRYAMVTGIIESSVHLTALSRMILRLVSLGEARPVSFLFKMLHRACSW